MTIDHEFKQLEPRSPFRDADGEKVIQLAYNYWQGLRTGTDIPLREDINPSCLEAALPHAFVAERVAPGMARMRVAGQGLQEMMKMELRAMPISSFLTVEARTALMPLIESAFADPAAIEIALKTEPAFGRRHIQARMLILPLKDEHLEVSRILGVLVTDKRTIVRPCRFSFATNPVVRFEKLAEPKPAKVRLVAKAKQEKSDINKILHIPPALRLIVDNT